MKKEAYAIRKRRKFVYEKEEKKKAGVKELSKFGKYYLKFKFPLVVVCFLLLLSGAISIISPIYAGKMIALFGDNFDQQKIIIYALVILGLSVIMQSHPISISSRMVSASLMVQYCTAMFLRCARRIRVALSRVISIPRS